MSTKKRRVINPKTGQYVEVPTRTTLPPVGGVHELPNWPAGQVPSASEIPGWPAGAAPPAAHTLPYRVAPQSQLDYLNTLLAQLVIPPPDASVQNKIKSYITSRGVPSRAAAPRSIRRYY